METKKFPHSVIYNGVFYNANTEIKVEAEKTPEKQREKKTTKNGGVE